jgi:hypothetical protein
LLALLNPQIDQTQTPIHHNHSHHRNPQTANDKDTMSSNQTSSGPNNNGSGSVEQFFSRNAAALVILFPFACLLLAATVKCCIVASERAPPAGNTAAEANKTHAAKDWDADMRDDGELGPQTCGIVASGPKKTMEVGSKDDRAVVDERVAAGYDGAYRGH